MNVIRKPAVYLAGPLGFFEAGRHYLSVVLLPLLAGEFTVLDPWAASESLVRDHPNADLARLNGLLGDQNRLMIEASNSVLAVLDGSDVDSGTAAEIGFAAGLPRPVVGLRTDMRMSGDNRATVINLQVEYFIKLSGGTLATDLSSALEALRDVTHNERPRTRRPLKDSGP